MRLRSKLNTTFYYARSITCGVYSSPNEYATWHWGNQHLLAQMWCTSGDWRVVVVPDPFWGRKLTSLTGESLAQCNIESGWLYLRGTKFPGREW